MKKKYIKFTIKDGIFKTKTILIEVDIYTELHIIAERLVENQMIYLEGTYYNISQILKITTVCN